MGTKVPNITTGLVLAAKSVGLFNDQEILKWIRKGKPISKEQQAIWRKMGKMLSLLFVEQFEKYKELSSYLKKEISSEEVKEWKSILNSQEYIWPIGKDKGWENVFNSIPKICENVSAVTITGKSVNTGNLNKDKHEDGDNESKK